VRWPAFLFALIIDSLLVWVPTTFVFLFAPELGLLLAAGSALALFAANWTLYSYGTTLGTYLGGFRLRTRNEERPGHTYGLIISLLTLVSVPATAALIALTIAPGVTNVSSFLGSPVSYPLFGERTRRPIPFPGRS
jgi:hypothetical protein